VPAGPAEATWSEAGKPPRRASFTVIAGRETLVDLR
jgi:hypothetical protein